MKIKVRSGKMRLSIPLPVGAAGLAIRAIPESQMEKMRQDVPEAYHEFISKEFFLMLFGECREIIKENKGLEVIHVEAHDGTFVSIRF